MRGCSHAQHTQQGWNSELASKLCFFLKIMAALSCVVHMQAGRVKVSYSRRAANKVLWPGCRSQTNQEQAAAGQDGDYRHKVILALLPHMIPMSCNKFGSNVVEVCPCQYSLNLDCLRHTTSCTIRSSSTLGECVSDSVGVAASACTARCVVLGRQLMHRVCAGLLEQQHPRGED